MAIIELVNWSERLKNSLAVEVARLKEITMVPASVFQPPHYETDCEDEYFFENGEYIDELMSRLNIAGDFAAGEMVVDAVDGDAMVVDEVAAGEEMEIDAA